MAGYVRRFLRCQDAEMRGGQTRIQHCVPIRALHAHHELVASDAGIVHQEVDLANLGERRLDSRLHLLFVRHVDDENRGFASRRRNLDDQFVKFLPIARRYRDGCALPRQRQGAGMTDTLRRSCNQRAPPLELHACSLGSQEARIINVAVAQWWAKTRVPCVPLYLSVSPAVMNCWTF